MSYWCISYLFKTRTRKNDGHKVRSKAQVQKQSWPWSFIQEWSHKPFSHRLKANQASSEVEADSSKHTGATSTGPYNTADAIALKSCQIVFYGQIKVSLQLLSGAHWQLVDFNGSFLGDWPRLKTQTNYKPQTQTFSGLSVAQLEPTKRLKRQVFSLEGIAEQIINFYRFSGG